MKRRTSIRLNQSYQGERIETKVRRLLEQKQPITDGAPDVWFTEEQGVPPLYDINTDRMALAVEAGDNTAKQYFATKNAAAMPETKQDTGGGEQAPPEQ